MLIWVPLYLSLSFFTNLLVTFLIGLRLWMVSRGLASLRTRSQFRRTVAILTVRGGTMIAFFFGILTKNVEIGISCALSNPQPHHAGPVRGQG
jgi:hypothetical protein